MNIRKNVAKGNGWFKCLSCGANIVVVSCLCGIPQKVHFLCIIIIIFCYSNMFLLAAEHLTDIKQAVIIENKIL
jgi:hypothetical protein